MARCRYEQSAYGKPWSLSMEADDLPVLADTGGSPD